jgi:hypothetical protein
MQFRYGIENNSVPRTGVPTPLESTLKPNRGIVQLPRSVALGASLPTCVDGSAARVAGVVVSPFIPEPKYDFAEQAGQVMLVAGQDLVRRVLASTNTYAPPSLVESYP